MLDPYRMIVVNIFASLTVGAILLFYKIFFPKKKINLFYFLLLISILPLISILRKGSYESGDLSLHIKYAMQFFDNITQGNFIPRWIGDHCGSYGCPEYIFIFFLPYYLISILHFIGLSFLASAKILIAGSFLLSGIGMYWWMRDELNEKAGFVAAIFYLFAPYHLIDLHFRVSIGELVSMAILPFLFLSVKLFIESRRIKHFFIVSLLFALLILSHQATSFIASPFIILYGGLVWFRNREKEISTIVLLLVSIALGVLLTAFYWLPILAESKYIFYGTLDSIDFHKFSEFIYSPHRFGLLFQGHRGQLYLNVGYAQWLIVIVSVFFLIKKTVVGKEKKLLLFSLISFFFLFILMQSFSKPLWDLFSFAKSIQFSWRLLIEAILFVSVMAGILAKNVKSMFLVVLVCSFTILYTILNWGNRKSEPLINDSVLRNQGVFTDKKSIELTTPIWARIDFSKTYDFPTSHIQTLSGSAQIKQLTRNQTHHQYLINAKTVSLIRENTFYYPGWEVLANYKSVPIFYENPKYPGVITFKLKPGIYKVDVSLTDTNDRAYSKIVSLIVALMLLMIGLYCFVFKKSPTKPKRKR